MSLQRIDAVSRSLLMPVSAWSRLHFCGFGILSRIMATTLAALAFGARMGNRRRSRIICRSSAPKLAPRVISPVKFPAILTPRRLDKPACAGVQPLPFREDRRRKAQFDVEAVDPEIIDAGIGRLARGVGPAATRGKIATLGRDEIKLLA